MHLFVKTKVIEALKMVKGVVSVSDKITRSDIEDLSADILLKEMKKGRLGIIALLRRGEK